MNEHLKNDDPFSRRYSKCWTLETKQNLSLSWTLLLARARQVNNHCSKINKMLRNKSWDPAGKKKKKVEISSPEFLMLWELCEDY